MLASRVLARCSASSSLLFSRVGPRAARSFGGAGRWLSSGPNSDPEKKERKRLSMYDEIRLSYLEIHEEIKDMKIREKVKFIGKRYGRLFLVTYAGLYVGPLAVTAGICYSANNFGMDPSALMEYIPENVLSLLGASRETQLSPAWASVGLGILVAELLEPARWVVGIFLLPAIHNRIHGRVPQGPSSSRSSKDDDKKGDGNGSGR